MATRRGHHQEDAARAVRAGPLDRHPGDHDRRQRRARLGRRLERRRRRHHRHRPGHARPVRTRTRSGRWAATRPASSASASLKQEGDSVVAMSVVQPEADLLVLTETGYGKRVALTEFRREAPRRPGRPADRPRGQEDRPRRRRPAGHRGGRGAAPDQRRRPGHPDRDELDQPLLVRRPRRDRRCASPRATGSSRSPPSAPGWRSADGIEDNDAPEPGGSGPAPGRGA